MSPVRRIKPLMKEHYEKIALLVVLLALLGSALFLLVQIGEARQAIERARWDHEEPVRPMEEIDTARFDAILNTVNNPYQIEVLDRNLMVSELRVSSVNPENIPAPIPYDAEICPFTGHEQPGGEFDTTGDGIPDNWYTQYGLDPFDRTMADRDVDGDGFTIREEYEWGTSPIDPDDHPPFAIRFRVEEVRQRPLELMFQGVQDFGDDEVFQINSRATDRTYFRRMGEKVEGFTIVDYQSRFREREDGRRIDESVLTLARDDREIRLVMDRRVQERERDAVIVSLLDDETFRVRSEDTFTYRGHEYNIIDIGRERVLIHDLNLDEEFEIDMLQPGERRQRLDPEDDFADPDEFELAPGLTDMDDF